MSVPIVPPAPARLSTMNCCPSRSVSFWAVKRAIWSDVLPGDPVITRTGRVGYLSASAACAGPAATSAANANTFRQSLIVPPRSALRNVQLLRHPVGALRLIHVAAVIHDVIAAFDDVEHFRARDFRCDALRVRRRREPV